MNDLTLIGASLKTRASGNLLSVALIAFGVMLATLILMLSVHVSERLTHDGKNIDLVVGAKGSPLQLILSSVYHIDIPTGNIPHKLYQSFKRHRHVKHAIPLALGDSWQNKRIVGTTHDYIHHYNGTLDIGVLWENPFEAVVGAQTGLKVGDIFQGGHGLAGDGHAHEQEYRVVGVLAPTQSVLDRLILTNLETVLLVHGQTTQEHDENDGHGHATQKLEPEITAILLKVKSPAAILNLPRLINKQKGLQAANPALEMVRLTSMMGLGSKAFSALSLIIIILACLSIFAGLASSFENRQSDLALMRALGFAQARLLKLMLFEGMLITISGLALGLILSCLSIEYIGTLIPPLSQSGIDTTIFVPGIERIIVGVFCAGIVSAMLPALKASRFDVAEQLSKG